MGLETTIAIVAAGIGVVLTPVYLYLATKGVKSLSDMRDMFVRPPGQSGRAGGQGQSGADSGTGSAGDGRR